MGVSAIGYSWFTHLVWHARFLERSTARPRWRAFRLHVIAASVRPPKRSPSTSSDELLPLTAVATCDLTKSEVTASRLMEADAEGEDMVGAYLAGSARSPPAPTEVPSAADAAPSPSAASSSSARVRSARAAAAASPKRPWSSSAPSAWRRRAPPCPAGVGCKRVSREQIGPICESCGLSPKAGGVRARALAQVAQRREPLYAEEVAQPLGGGGGALFLGARCLAEELKRRSRFGAGLRGRRA